MFQNYVELSRNV